LRIPCPSSLLSRQKSRKKVEWAQRNERKSHFLDFLHFHCHCLLLCCTVQSRSSRGKEERGNSRGVPEGSLRLNPSDQKTTRTTKQTRKRKEQGKGPSLIRLKMRKREEKKV